MCTLVIEVEGLKKKLAELRSYGKKHPPSSPLTIEMCTVQEKLRSIDDKFYKHNCIDPRKPLTISGFPMPLQCEEDVDRLELMVNRNPKIRAQYIEFLRCKKPLSVEISECFGKFFTGEALANFSWRSIKTSEKPRNAMTDYHIFTTCMLEAWEAQVVTGFCFPLSCHEDIERLESTIRINPTVRFQYVRFLASKKPPNETIAACFKLFFTHWSLYNFCLQKTDGPERKKQSMREFKLFTDCMLEAWQSHGLNENKLLTELQIALTAAHESINQCHYKPMILNVWKSASRNRQM
uniref:DUF4806 domain-containing protein n=1 Tax=Anopheles christyi TaxID=43041 RepID=A0A182JNL3_9DIPT